MTWFMKHTSSIFKAEPRHAEIISRLGTRTFAETFVGMSYYTQELIDGYTIDAFAPEVLRQQLADPKMQYFLAKVDDTFVGYAALKEREPAACVKEPKAVCLDRLYLTKGAQGRGLGSGMLNEVYKEARARGFEFVWLSVWEHNLPAQNFYTHHGYKRIGEWDWPFESDGVQYVDLDHIMMVRVPD